MTRARVLALLALAACKKDPPPAPAAMPKPVEPTLQVRVGGTGGSPPALPFTIGTVYEKQQPTAQPPFHADGGKWTFFDATLADGTPFTVGLFERLTLQSEPPMTLVDGQLSVASSADGEKLARAYAQAFGTKVPPPGKTLGAVALKVASVNLGTGVQRAGTGFGGKGGTWTASKWTLERAQHAAEVYFNFSLAEKKGEWSQKDEDYDAFVAKDLMEVLHDGVP